MKLLLHVLPFLSILQACSANISWRRCYRNYYPGVVYECSDFQVPLDYDKPNGAQIQLSLVRRRATASKRIGSLLVNPGGPGGSGVDFAIFLGAEGGYMLGPVLDRYDIVGFDPRGVGRSTPLQCFRNENQAFKSVPDSLFPFTAEEVPEFEELAMFLNDKCVQRGNKVLGHTSTANVARDMDKIRAELGEAKLNFYGLSYGTLLGMTYANMFPDNVGAFVIDGNIDPNAWTNLECQVTTFNAIRSDQGAQQTLDEFIKQCNEAGKRYCPLAPGAGPRIDAVLESLKSTPIIVLYPDGFSELFDYTAAVSYLLISLYTPSSFPFVAEFIALIEEASPDPKAIGFAIDNMLQRAGFANKRRRYFNFAEAFPAVVCSDSCNPTDFQAIYEDGKAATATYGYFGEPWNWANFQCASWTTQDGDAYLGPFNKSTATPVLVVGNLYDPATRYDNAKINRKLLPNSILLTVDTPGHCSLDLNQCADARVAKYLADPLKYQKKFGDSTCEKEWNWFDFWASPPPDNAVKTFGSFRSKFMEEIAVLPF